MRKLIALMLCSLFIAGCSNVQYTEPTMAPIAPVTEAEAEVQKLVDKYNETAVPSHIVANFTVRETPFEKTSVGKIKRIQG